MGNLIGRLRAPSAPRPVARGGGGLITRAPGRSGRTGHE